MKKENKIYSLFIVIALFFWNPLALYLFYSDTPVITIKVVWIIYSVIFLSGIVSIWIISRDGFKGIIKDSILSLSIFGIFFGGIIFWNFLIEEKSDQSTTLVLEQGLIFPKNHIVTNKTLEFDYQLITNSIGIRDKEIAIDKGDNYRILCFGDSWVEGHGVNIEYSWPRKLQDFFSQNGYKDIEVINCGKGGAYTTSYLDYMNKTIPLLKPDLVLVGILQGNDLSQLYEMYNPPTIEAEVATEPKDLEFSKMKYIISTFFKYSTIHILERISLSNKSIDLEDNNINTVKKIIDSFDYLQKKQYDLLSDSVKYYFETGNLNPGLLQGYTSLSYGISVFNDPSHKATKLAIDLMDKDIKMMKNLCEKNNSQLVFINLPTAFFTGHNVVRTPNDIFKEYFMQNNRIDSMYQRIAVGNQLPYIELTDHFLKLFPKNKYFYKYDGHPNKNGYLEIANYIGNELINQKIIK